MSSETFSPCPSRDPARRRRLLLVATRRERESHRKGFVQGIEKLAVKNSELRRVLYTARNCQLILMALKPKEEIGADGHKLDPFFRVEEGSGEAVLDGVRAEIRAGFAEGSTYPPTPTPRRWGIPCPAVPAPS
jgi:mannose-6-phosphate isomerase-like protein (cupin superfamily)